MSPKTILAYLNSARHAKGILETAFALARKFDAHVIGLHVIPLVSVPAIVPFEVSGEIIEMQRKVLDDEARRIAQAHQEAAAASMLRHEWREVRASHYDVASIVNTHARAADLVIAGQSEASSDTYLPTDVTEDLMMDSGRPVLIVPRASENPAATGSRILVAWNESREATRAVFDAMPFLQAAGDVRIVTVNPGHGRNDPALPGAELAATLSRHGIKVEAEVAVAPGQRIADELVSRAKASGCDLIVMGGYGHSRLGELVFGGATREMLRQCPVPLLISH